MSDCIVRSSLAPKSRQVAAADSRFAKSAPSRGYQGSGVDGNDASASSPAIFDPTAQDATVPWQDTATSARPWAARTCLSGLGRRGAFSPSPQQSVRYPLRRVASRPNNPCIAWSAGLDRAKGAGGNRREASPGHVDVGRSRRTGILVFAALPHQSSRKVSDACAH